jgi:membrane protein
LFAFLEKLNEKIWSQPQEGAAAILRIPVYVARIVIAVARDIGEGHLSLRATSLVYTTLLSLVPVLAVAFSVLKGMGVHDQVEPFLKNALSPLGPQGDEITGRIIGFVNNINVGVLGVVGLALLFYSVISLMHKIEDALNDIWRVPSSRPMAVRVRDYMVILLLGPLFIFLSVGMTATLKHAAIVQQYLPFDIVGSALEYVFSVVPYVLFTLAFSMVYMFLPNTRVRLVPALAAGFVTGVMWKALGYLFGTFVAGSGSYAAIYSAFAAVILFMIWIYMGWLIVLIGASVSYYLQNPSNQRMSRRIHHLGQRLRDKVALQALSEIGRSFYAHERGLAVQELARRMFVPVAVLDEVVADLQRAKILTDSPSGLLPLTPYDTTSVADALLALRHADDHGFLSAERVYACAIVEKSITAADAALRAALGNITLKDISTGEDKA